MRGSFVVAGLEVAVQSRGLALERALLTVLEPYLSDTRDPVCCITMRPAPASGAENRATEAEGGRLQFSSGWWTGTIDPSGESEIDLAPTPAAVALFLRTVWSAVALEHGAALVAAMGLLSGPRAHVFVDGDAALLSRLATAQHKPLLSASHVALARDKGGWIAASTPFDGERVAAPRSGRLAAIWFPATEDLEAVAAVRPTVTFRALLDRTVRAMGPAQQRTAFERAADVAAAVPGGVLGLSARSRWETIDGLGAALKARQTLLSWERPQFRAQAF